MHAPDIISLSPTRRDVRGLGRNWCHCHISVKLFWLQVSRKEKSCCPWSHGLRPKKLLVTVAVPPAPVRVPSQRPLTLRSIASVTSVANDKGDNEMILVAVHRSPGICLTTEENPRKPQL